MKKSLKNERNSLSFIKILAAFQVMIGHLIEHLQLPFPDAARKALSYYTGVPIFFIVSGYLIWLSIGRSASYGEYLRKRFWRIYPELWVAVIIEILSIIVLYDGWNKKDLLLFSLTQGTILQFWTPDSLRGYGCGTPNGTLWTMCVMIQFYIVAWVLYKLFRNKRLVFWVVGFVAFIAVSMIGQQIFDKIGIEVFTKLYNQTIVRYCWLFFFGCFLAENKEQIVRSVLTRSWLMFLIIALIIHVCGYDLKTGYSVVHSVTLVSGLIGFAYRFPQLSIKKDISYGIFLYHMIIVNVFMNYDLIENWIYATLVIIITVVMAYVSCITVGAWSSKKKLNIKTY